MNICLAEPFFSGSHKQWAEGLKKFSGHRFEFLTLPGRHWKWRMQGGAVALANRYLERGLKPDLILATDMLDLATFLSLIRKDDPGTPAAVYFHENQLTYPWSPQDRDVQKNRDHNYMMLNYTTALIADKVFFNSNYHKRSFLKSLPKFLKKFPDFNGVQNVDKIAEKSEVLHLGLDLKRFDEFSNSKTETGQTGILLWNHRWEYDKKPDVFFKTLFRLKDEGIDFRLVVLGEKNQQYPEIFDRAREKLSEKILHWGYAESFAEYAGWLWKADILPVTSIQDFFGGSVAEAMYCNCVPLLPNRLAYPEHIPLNRRNYFLYEKPGDLYRQLKTMLECISEVRKEKTQSFVHHYDWNRMIKRYDTAFQDLSNSTA